MLTSPDVSGFKRVIYSFIYLLYVLYLCDCVGISTLQRPEKDPGAILYFVPPYSLEQVLSVKQKFAFLARLTGDRTAAGLTGDRTAAGVCLYVPTNRGTTGVNIHTQISICLLEI